MIIVLDTNIFISAIVKDSTTRRLIIESEHILLCTKIKDFWHPRNPKDFYDFRKIYSKK